jgi:hypothetical protein
MARSQASQSSCSPPAAEKISRRRSRSGPGQGRGSSGPASSACPSTAALPVGAERGGHPGPLLARWHRSLVPIGLVGSELGYALLALTESGGHHSIPLLIVELFAIGIGFGLSYGPVVGQTLSKVSLAATHTTPMSVSKPMNSRNRKHNNSNKESAWLSP